MKERRWKGKEERGEKGKGREREEEERERREGGGKREREREEKGKRRKREREDRKKREERPKTRGNRGEGMQDFPCLRRHPSQSSHPFFGEEGAKEREKEG